MGIIASVMCNCYRDGITTPCPFPNQFIADPTTLPGLQWEEEPDEQEAERAFAKFRAWLEVCCEHRNMNYANEFITSWNGYQAFTDALEAMDRVQFRTLLKHLPDGEDGISTPDDCRVMLGELDQFVLLQSEIRHAVLMDSERGDVISMGSHTLKGKLAMNPTTGLDIGFDEQGFFIRDRWEMNRVLFRAMRLEQRLLHPEASQVDYVDLDSDRVFRCNTPFGKVMTGDDGLPRMVYARLHIDLVPSAENRFAYVIEPLRRVFEASIETGNPVRWQ